MADYPPLSATPTMDFPALGETEGRKLKPGEHWTNPIQETHPKIGRLGRVGLKTFADAGPETFQRAIEQRYGLEARPLGNMRFAVKAPEEKEWRTVDPGWSMKQPLEPLYDVADVIPSWALLGLGYLKGGAEGAATGTALGGPVGGVVGGALGSAAGSAAAEEVKQELGGMLGYQVDPGEQARKVATEALAGGAGRLLEPVFGLGIKGGEAGLRALVRSRLGRGAAREAPQVAAQPLGESAAQAPETLQDLLEGLASKGGMTPEQLATEKRLLATSEPSTARQVAESAGIPMPARETTESVLRPPRTAETMNPTTEQLLAEWEARGPAQTIEQLPERRAVPRPPGEKALTTEERLRLLKGRLETAGKDVEELSAFNQGTKQLGEVGSLKTGLGEKAGGTARREVVDQWDEEAKKFRHWLMEEQPGGQMKRIAETDAQGIPIKYDVSVGGQTFRVEPGAAPAIPPSQAAPAATIENFAAKTAKEAAERLRWKGYGGLAGGAPPTAREMERVIMETLQNPAEDVRQLEEIFKRGLIDPVEEQQKPAFAALLKAGVDQDDARRMVMEYDLPAAGKPRPPPGGGGAPYGPPDASFVGPGEGLRAGFQDQLDQAIEAIGKGRLDVDTVGRLLELGKGRLTQDELKTAAGAIRGAVMEAEQAGRIDYMQREQFLGWLRNAGFGSRVEKAAAPTATEAASEAATKAAQKPLDFERRKVRGWTELWVNGEQLTSFHPSDLGLLANIEKAMRHAEKYGYGPAVERTLRRWLQASGVGDRELEVVIEKVRRLYRRPGGAPGGPSPAGVGEMTPGEELAATLREKGRGGPSTPPEAPPPSGPPGAPPTQPAPAQGGAGEPERKLRMLGVLRELLGGTVRMAGGALEFPERLVKRGAEAGLEAIPRGTGERIGLSKARRQTKTILGGLARGLKGLRFTDPESHSIAQRTANDVIDTLSRPLLRSEELERAGKSLAAGLEQLGGGKSEELLSRMLSTVKGPKVTGTRGQSFLGVSPTRLPETGILSEITGIGSSVHGSTTLGVIGGMGMVGKGFRRVGMAIMTDASGDTLRRIIRGAPGDVQAALMPVLQKLGDRSAFRAAAWSAMHSPVVRQYLERLSGNDAEARQSR